MANLVKALNLTNHRARLYEIPVNCMTGETYEIKTGDLINVQFGGGSTALAIATCDSWAEDDAGVKAIKNAFGMADGDSFRKVVAIYSETKILASVEDAEEADATEGEGETEEG